MKPIALIIGYVVVVLMVHGSSADRLLSETIKTVNGPYHFSYFSYNEYMLFEIILKNIPPSVTKIYLIYSGKAKFFDNEWTPEKLIIDKEVKNGEVTIPSLNNLLQYQHILIDVELETTEGLCTKSRVTEGRYMYSSPYWVEERQQLFYWNTNWTYDRSNFCRLPNICEIVVDFQNQCKEIFSCDYNATKYTCTLHHEKLDSSPTYNMFQNYYVKPRLNLRSGNHSPTNTKLIMELETFDNNTTVNVINTTDPNNILWFDKINLTSKDVVKDIIVGTLNYSESTDIQFSCEEYISRPKINNTRLCTKPLWCAVGVDLSKIQCSSNITITNAPDRVESPKMSNANNTNSTVTIVSSLCGVGFTALVIVGIWWCWSARRPQGTHGLPPNQPTEPFYLNMLFRRQCDQEIAEIDQLYEEIDQHHTPGVVRG